MRNTIMIAAILTLPSASAMADTSLAITFDLDGADVATTTYDCGPDTTLAVKYITSEANALALLPVEGAERVFAGVVAASGSRYVSGPYEWWADGETAMLTDLIADKMILECEASQQ
ncbi:MliC family protein [Paracoccus marinaquae]|uniref:MliC family protein n=1 Tax=Paracoccus marinaquae TaxID=2841926 RepID=A0ABS6AHW4_9RHOB|nr:MliC family protein [Paracoccus marinaquae]MBU3030188.1 MliC family protein [Paracoccus marinaquae]